jgi:4-amino-4-deoxy-L-arabinose transferase-like glycosyltransferase
MSGTYTPTEPQSSPLTPSARPGGRFRTAWHEASPTRRAVWIAIALLVFTELVRIAYVLHTRNYVARQDAQSYNYLAQTLARGNGWGYGNSAYRPPGYPVFLAGIYLLVGLPNGVFTAARLVQTLLATATIGLIGVMAWQLAGRRAALISLAIGSIYIPLVLIGVALMTEALFTPLLLIATICALQCRRVERRQYLWIVLSGFFCGLASLTRGNGILLMFPLALVVWTTKPRWSWRALAAPLTLLVVACATISPWTIRNANAQHAFIPVTDELGNTIKGTYNPVSARQRFVWNGHGYSTYDSIQNNKKLTEAQRDSELTHAVIRYIGKHPEYLPEAMFWNTLRLLDLQGRRISRVTAYTDTFATYEFADIGVVCFWIVGVLAILGGFTLAARRVPKSFWTIPFILWLSVAPVTTGTPRFRAALDPFFIALAAFALEAIWAWALRRRGGRGDPVPGAAPAPA